MADTLYPALSGLQLKGFTPQMLVATGAADLEPVLQPLRDSGFAVQSYKHGAEALEWLSRNHADLVVAAQQLNNMTGVEFLERCNTLMPMAGKILLTPDLDVPLALKAVNDARTDYLVRLPLTNGDLYDAVALIWAGDVLPAKEKERRIEDDEALIADLRRMNYDLETRIQQHTDELTKANEHLKSSLDEILRKNRALTQLNESLNIQATVDPLTGLFNRREFNNRLDAEWARWKRHRRPLSLVMLDIDHFKAINDTYGHEGGDVVLQSLALLMKTQQRRQDVVCRYGGEEFVIILPDTEMEAAFAVSDKLRRRVAEQPFHYKDKKIEVHMSLGVAGAKEMDPQDQEAFFEIADAALYLAKRRGRNRVIIADPVNRETVLREAAD